MSVPQVCRLLPNFALIAARQTDFGPTNRENKKKMKYYLTEETHPSGSGIPRKLDLTDNNKRLTTVGHFPQTVSLLRRKLLMY